MATGAAEAAALDAWAELRPHVEWPDGFSLSFVFAAGTRVADALRGLAEDGARLRSRKIVVMAPGTTQDVDELAAKLLQRQGPGCGGVWVDLAANYGDDAWDRARARLFAQLNQHRLLMVRDLGVPIVFVLPADLRARVVDLAPDLWAIRSFTWVLPAEAILVAQRTAVEREWARLFGLRDRVGVDLLDAVAAAEAALERGCPADARRIATEALKVAAEQTGVEPLVGTEPLAWSRAVARIHDATSPTHTATRTSVLRIATVAGRAEWGLGNRDAAREALSAGLEVARRLRVTLGDMPRVLRDLAYSLFVLAYVEQHSGLGTNAQARMQEFSGLIDDARRLYPDDRTFATLRDAAGAFFPSFPEDERGRDPG